LIPATAFVTAADPRAIARGLGRATVTIALLVLRSQLTLDAHIREFVAECPTPVPGSPRDRCGSTCAAEILPQRIR